MKDKFYLAIFLAVLTFAVLTSPFGMILGAIYGAFTGLGKGAAIWITTISHIVVGYPK